MIRSRSNPRVKALAALQRSSGRRKENQALAEGVHLAQEALASGAEVQSLILSERAASHPEVPLIRSQAEARGVEVLELSGACYEKISTLRSPEGVAVTVRLRLQEASVLLADPSARLLVAAGVQDAGNAGALARTAEASGCTGLILLGGADPTGPRFLRAAMGSAFRLACARTDVDDFVEAVGQAPARLLIADAGEGAVAYAEGDYTPPLAIGLGSEGEGVPEALCRVAVGRIRIPMQAPVESLNVAVAAGIILYQACRVW